MVFNATRSAAEAILPNVIMYEELIDGSDEDFAWLCTDENMAMGMCYTSGTTLSLIHISEPTRPY